MKGRPNPTPRIARALGTLRAQVNAFAPKRSKKTDGWIGDRAHMERASDHNPNQAGVVTALDITHDPAGGLDSYKLAETLRQNRDDRIKYVISAGKIFSSTVSPWQWRKYTGSNSHHQHVHVSVDSSPALYDDARKWLLDGGPLKSAPTRTTPPTLWRGAKGKDVKRLQALLRIKADGAFGPPTERAVRNFQKRNRLTVDGVAGMYTWLALLS